MASARRRPALPRRVGRVYLDIGRVYRDWWSGILLLAVVVFVPLGLIDAAAAQVDVESLQLDSGIKVFALIAAAGAVTTTGLLGEVFFAGAISISLTHPEGDGPPRVRQIARRINYWRLILLDIAYVVMVAAGLLLLLLPGIAAFVLFGLSGPAVELEERTVRGALARSYRLVRTDFWLVFWVLVPIELAGDALGSGAEHLVHNLLGDTFFSTWLAEVASNIILSPLFAVAAVLLLVGLIGASGGSGPRIRSLSGGEEEELRLVA
ncbi:MAG: hypothetical protein JST31_07110 [Actinobacteria bacterium]|nr:hypothetical protein [Actinomycetota bacterium]